MRRSVLIVEDEKLTRTAYTAAMRSKGWTVHVADTGKRALQLLRGQPGYDVMLLDWRLPDMDGDKVLAQAERGGLKLPPVFVVSAYPEQAWDKLRQLRVQVQGLLPKPVEEEVLPEILGAFCDGDEGRILKVPDLAEEEYLKVYIIEHKRGRSYLYRRKSEGNVTYLKDARIVPDQRAILHEEVAQREAALLAHFRNSARLSSCHAVREPLLVIGRRWNSWYPSYFQVDGGAYVVLGGRAKARQCPACMIDPGFRALAVLRELGIPLPCISSCLITHNHPDHIGGIFEYVSARHVLGTGTRLFCTKPVEEMLACLSGSTLDISEFTDEQVELIGPYTAADGSTRRVRATPVPTSHYNAGQIGGTRGILITSDRRTRGDSDFSRQASALLLGDTEYRSDTEEPAHAVFDGIREHFKRRDLRVAVLHIGSSQLKSGTGKHLYLPGLIDILKDIEFFRRGLGLKERLLILVSEWGLEHASKEQLRRAMDPTSSQKALSAFDSQSLVAKTIDVVKASWEFGNLTILPADIGLAVGIESGRIYLNGSESVDPDNVVVKSNERGLTYHLSR